ncbi:hypothetical protein [Rhizobium wuzhouense]|uniref:Helix-turn-helix domain-containing protein n=1 Tax=Rhizobium wuzhouense TaxID=1986026 RepID=A0ABX5NPJ8_9HYPH|nr:hypothetical protein [Rhizobium wuzhouense]PYB71280.1 hypothetical protein DMY87_18140 [Rhizobium wuzhouense]
MSAQATSDIAVDLFGQPVQALRDPRGRKSYKKSPENQQLVSVLRASGWTHERIAAVLQCDEKTLRKHFSRELEVGKDIVEAETLMVNYSQMRQGKSGAIARQMKILEHTSLQQPRKSEPKVPREPKKETLGKKAQLESDAHNGLRSSSWGDVLQ